MSEIPWGMLIVVYLFLGGMSAGLFFVSTLATALQRTSGGKVYERIARIGGLLAPWPVAGGSVLLIFDLGQMLRFYHLFMSFKLHSPMSLGSWLLMAFMGAAMGYFWAWLPTEWVEWIANKLPNVFRKIVMLLAWPGREKLRLPLAIVGLPLCIGVGVYTGVLLGIVQAKTFWNINLLAQMFLFSGLSSGAAVLLFAMALYHHIDEREASLLMRVDVALILLEVFVLVHYLAYGVLFPLGPRHALSPILGGPYTFAFWVLFLAIGVLLPLGIEIYELKPGKRDKPKFHHNRLLSGATAGLIIVGGFMLRYIFVYAGQLAEME